MKTRTLTQRGGTVGSIVARSLAIAALVVTASVGITVAGAAPSASADPLNCAPFDGGFGAPNFMWEVTWGQPTPTSGGPAAFTKDSYGGLTAITWNGINVGITGPAIDAEKWYPRMNDQLDGTQMVYTFADGTRWTALAAATVDGCDLTVEWQMLAPGTHACAPFGFPGGFGDPLFIWEVTWGQPTPTSGGPAAFTKDSYGGLTAITWNGINVGITGPAIDAEKWYPRMNDQLDGTHMVYTFADGTQWTADAVATADGCDPVISWAMLAPQAPVDPDPAATDPELAATGQDGLGAVGPLAVTLVLIGGLALVLSRRLTARG